MGHPKVGRPKVEITDADRAYKIAAEQESARLAHVAQQMVETIRLIQHFQWIQDYIRSEIATRNPRIFSGPQPLRMHADTAEQLLELHRWFGATPSGIEEIFEPTYQLREASKQVDKAVFLLCLDLASLLVRGHATPYSVDQKEIELDLLRAHGLTDLQIALLQDSPMSVVNQVPSRRVSSYRKRKTQKSRERNAEVFLLSFGARLRTKLQESRALRPNFRTMQPHSHCIDCHTWCASLFSWKKKFQTSKNS